MKKIKKILNNICAFIGFVGILLLLTCADADFFNRLPAKLLGIACHLGCFLLVVFAYQNEKRWEEDEYIDSLFDDDYMQKKI